MQPTATTNDTGKLIDITHGVYFMPDWLSFAIVIGLTVWAGVLLRFVLVWLRVPVRVANHIAGTLTVFAVIVVYLVVKAMQNP